MENTAKIRYKLQPIFETGVAFQLQYYDKRFDGALITSNHFCVSTMHHFVDIVSDKINLQNLAKKPYGHISFATKDKRDEYISNLHIALAEFAVKWYGWLGDVWYWDERGKCGRCLPAVLGDDLSRCPVCKYSEAEKKGGWLPWSSDMPLPKPRELGNNTWEV